MQCFRLVGAGLATISLGVLEWVLGTIFNGLFKCSSTESFIKKCIYLVGSMLGFVINRIKLVLLLSWLSFFMLFKLIFRFFNPSCTKKKIIKNEFKTCNIYYYN